MGKLVYEKVANLQLAIREVAVAASKVDGLYIVQKVDGMNDILLWMSTKGLRMRVVYSSTL